MTGVSNYELLRLFQKEISNKVDEKLSVLSKGTAPDFGAYKYECGYITGLQQSINFLREAIKKVGNIDEDE